MYETVADPDPEIREGGGGGGVGRHFIFFFSFWSKNKGGAPLALAPPLDPPL